MPQPSPGSGPQIAAPILKEGAHSESEAAVLTIALDVCIPDRAEFPGGNRLHAYPDSSIPILNQRINPLRMYIRIASQFAVLPTGQPLVCANPKSSVTRDEQPSNKAAREMLTFGRLPGNRANAIEPKQTQL
jgi:hypothetical protein